MELPNTPPADIGYSFVIRNDGVDCAVKADVIWSVKTRVTGPVTPSRDRFGLWLVRISLLIGLEQLLDRQVDPCGRCELQGCALRPH